MEAQTEAFTSHIVQANSDAAAAERDAKRWLVLAGVLMNIVVGILVLLLSRSIRRSLRSVRDVAQALARGDLQARNLNPGTDALGELGRAINGMADSLHKVTGHARADGEAVNSCTRLRGRPCGPVSAVCVPVNFMGRSLGVLRAAAPVGKLPDATQIAHLTTLGAQAGARIGTVRAFHSTQQKAATDSLTGLHNRRSAEERARDLVATGRPFAVVLADLDHFKKLNDSRGHEAGDKALRLFAETLRLCMRDGDMASRWGGEEFVLLMPNANAQQANEAVDRIRASLATALLTGGTAAFTSSFGIADSTMSPRFERMVKIADEALYRAKEEGRDPAIICDSRLANTRGFPRAVEHPASITVRKLAEG